ncbi:hypothetical protein B0A48_13619 [Cryoendolithus antarcticus]|uniref:deoxyribose-phosphate aldolase n=1 Tax=Cryoendolithus antarcticus TaxID=1507870 RepID=A0A1V8SPF3_9PEZI|nr:hypothetical protein B0A48_13619 [Cryoendolithus antarcticus]
MSSHQRYHQPYTIISRTITRDKVPLLPPYIRRTTKTMTTARYTNAEWSDIISHAQSTILSKLDNDAPPTKTTDLFSIAGAVDHTLLKLDATAAQVDSLCAEARVHNFATVCVRLPFVARCRANVSGSGVGIACVIGFHEGTQDVREKLTEAKSAVAEGATELDVVVNVPMLKDGKWEAIYSEFSALRAVAGKNVACKLILETALLSNSEIVAGCVLASEAGFDFVKTSTGFLTVGDLPPGVTSTGATLPHVRLLSLCCTSLPQTSESGEVRQMRVKASGGIRTLEDAVKMMAAGAERLGTSGGVWIAKEAEQAAHHLEGKAGGNGEVRVEELRRGSVTEIVRESAGEGMVGGGERPGLQTRLFTDY